MSERLPARCPDCGSRLKRVRQSGDSMLNSEQFDAIKAGDYFCQHCTGDRGRSGFRYFWEHELRTLP